MALKKYLPTHTSAHLVTVEKATTLPIGHVVNLAVQRYSKVEGDHLQALYNRIKGKWFLCRFSTLKVPLLHIYTCTDGYNKYVELIGGAIGAGACAAFTRCKDGVGMLYF